MTSCPGAPPVSPLARTARSTCRTTTRASFIASLTTRKHDDFESSSANADRCGPAGADGGCSRTAGRASARARSADRSHLQGQRIRATAIWSRALARRWYGLYDRRAGERWWIRHRALRRRQRHAQRPDLERAAHARGHQNAALDRRLRVVGRWHEAVDLYEHAEGVAQDQGREYWGLNLQGGGLQPVRARAPE